MSRNARKRPVMVSAKGLRDEGVEKEERKGRPDRQGL